MRGINTNTPTNWELYSAARTILKCAKSGAFSTSLREVLYTVSLYTLDPIFVLSFARRYYRNMLVAVVAMAVGVIALIATTAIYWVGWITFHQWLVTDAAVISLTLMLPGIPNILLERSTSITIIPELTKTCAKTMLMLSRALDISLKDICRMHVQVLKQKIRDALIQEASLMKCGQLPTVTARDFDHLKSLYREWAERLQNFDEIYKAAVALKLADDVRVYFPESNR